MQHYPSSLTLQHFFVPCQPQNLFTCICVTCFIILWVEICCVCWQYCTHAHTLAKKWAQNANCKWCNKACGGVLHLSVITKNICLFALLVCASMFFFFVYMFYDGLFVCVFCEYMWPHYRIFANICTICFHQERLWYAWKLV